MHLRKKFEQSQALKKAENTPQTEIEQLFMELSPKEVQSLILNYETAHNVKILPSPQPPTDRFSDFLKREDVQIVCPHCQSKVFCKHGTTTSGKPRFRCNQCGKTFSPFNGTLVQSSGLEWDIWVELVYCVLNSKALVDIR